MSKRDKSDSGCLGGVSFVLLAFVAWALLFGVSVDGKHYGVHGCSCEGGVQVDARQDGGTP